MEKPKQNEIRNCHDHVCCKSVCPWWYPIINVLHPNLSGWVPPCEHTVEICRSRLQASSAMLFLLCYFEVHFSWKCLELKQNQDQVQLKIHCSSSLTSFTCVSSCVGECGWWRIKKRWAPLTSYALFKITTPLFGNNKWVNVDANKLIHINNTYEENICVHTEDRTRFPLHQLRRTSEI